MTQPSPGFGRILVGVDFSPSSQHTLEVVRGRFPGALLGLARVMQRAERASDLKSVV